MLPAANADCYLLPTLYSGGAQAKAAAQAVAQALTAGGGQAQAFAQALAQAVSSGGCGAVSTVLAGGWLPGQQLRPCRALLTGISQLECG